MIKRERYMERIRPFIGNELIKVLTGIRRSGKSVMLEMIKEELMNRGIKTEQIISFNFESLSNAPFTTAETLYAEIRNRISSLTGKVYLFFDEIQEVKDWEKCVNSLRVDCDCDIYITGSNAKLLSGDLATYLGGRYVEFVIYPFSFEEYLEGIDPERKDISGSFRRYLESGGMPFITALPDDKTVISQYLRDVYHSIILKDVVRYNSIRDVDLLERVITYVMANVGHTFSARSISDYFRSENRKVAPETVLNYIRACCNANLFCRVDRQDIPGKKILSVNEKYYIEDHGFREAVFGGNMRDIDQLLENIVCMELIRRGYTVYTGKSGDKEIDFVAEKGSEKIYVQVSYLLASEETVEREFGVLRNTPDNYPKYVLSMDGFDRSRDGIRHRSVPDFLLMDRWD